MLCGKEEESSSSSSSSSEEDEADMMAGPSTMAAVAPAPTSPDQAVSSSNVVPLLMPVKARPPVGCIDEGEVSALLQSLPAGASVRVCQGKACCRAGSAQLLATLQQRGEAADVQVSSSKCMDMCKKGAATVEVLEGGEKRSVQLSSALQLAKV